jgi:hypothetical protein
MSVNKKHKDTVFVNFFSDEARLIELYNAISGENYDKTVPISINTLSDVIFKNRKNDISFLLNNRLIVFYEHQSTINENMALRFLIYLARIYEKIMNKSAIYRRKQIKIPRPEFIVLYNGVANYPEYSELKLSDAFIDAGIEKPAIDLTVKIFNINKGQNANLVEKSRNLNDYVIFIDKIREFQAELKDKIDDEKHQSENLLEEAIIKAVYWCIENDIMKDFLETNSSEVKNMVMDEWDMDIALEVAKEEGMEENIEEVLEFIKQGYSTEMIEEKLLNRKACSRTQRTVQN